MQYPRAEYSASKSGMGSTRSKNDCVPCAGTSQDYRKRNVCQVDQQSRVSQGFKRPEKWFFRVCGRAKNPRNRCNGSQLIPTDSKLVESSSTQTWEPWNRGTCVSKFLKCERLNQTVIAPRQGCLTSFENEPNDNYDRLSELRDQSNDQGKSSAAAKSSTTCNRDGCGVCEAMRDRVFAEMALQTDATSYKIIMCGPTKDQTQNINLNEKSSKASPKSRLHPGPSSSRTTKVSNKTNKKLVKKKTSVGLQTKKPGIVKKRSTPKACKTVAKKINSSFSDTRGEKFKTGKRRRVTTGKKPEGGKTTGKGATSNRVTATTDAALPMEIMKQEDAVKTVGNLVKKDAGVDEVVAKVEIDNDGNEPCNEGVEAIAKAEKVSREYPEQDISILNETFEVKRSSTDKVSSKNSEDDEPDGKETSTCSSKCQGILTRRSDYVKVSISSSSSSKKQFENGSTTPEKMENVRRSHRIKPKSTLKSEKAQSSTSSSIERDDPDPPRKKKPKRSSVTKANSAEKDPTPGKTIIQKIGKDNSGTVTSEVVSTGESGGKSNTTIRENEDRSHSSDYEKLNCKKSSRQSSVMMIWHWLRERYHDTPTKASSSFGSTDREVKDPFLSLFLPVMQTQKYQNFQVN